MRYWMAALLLIPDPGSRIPGSGVRDPGSGQDNPLRVTIEAKRLNPAGKMPVRFMIENATESTVQVDEPADWTTGLEIRDAQDKVVKDFGSAEPKGKVKLEARAFTGRTADIASALAGKTFDEGTFKLTWKHAGAVSKQIEVLLVRDYRVKIETNLGDISIDLLPENAPANVMHFIGLVRKGFYDGKIFHRLIPGFMMQGGNSKKDGRGRYALRVKGEFTQLKHVRGTVAMARYGDPDSAETDFYICFADYPAGDGQYSIIGQITRESDRVLGEAEQVNTDHNPCKGCGKAIDPKKPTEHCGKCHLDRPEIEIVMKKVTLTERKD